MANVIKHKRGSGSDPVASDLVVGEVAIRTDVGKLFTKMDNGSVAEIAGGGSDIAINTLSSSSGTGGGSATFNGSAYRFTLSQPPSVSAQQLLVSINGVIQKPVAGTGQPSEGFSVDGTDIILGDAPATGSDFFILTFKSLGVSEPADNSVTSAKIVDGAIVNADINASAAIAGTKISPDFGSQNIVTTGTLGSGNFSLTSTQPRIRLIDSNTNPDLSIINEDGVFNIYDDTNSASRFTIDAGKIVSKLNHDFDAGIDVTGNTTFANGNRTLDLTLADSPTTGNVGCQFRAGAADFLGLAAGGGTDIGLVVDASNNVGIGTSSPDRTIHCHNSSNTTNVRAKFSNGTTGEGASDGFEIGINASDPAEAVLVNYENSPMVFFTNASPRMRITSDGRVFIGSTNPAAAANADDLCIGNNDGSGETGITLGSNTASGIRFADGNSNSAGVLEYQHNNDRFAFAAGGSVRLRVDEDGIKFNNDTAAANALSDYEEGTWSPAVQQGVTNTQTFDSTGRYTKIGRQVYCQFLLQFSGAGTGDSVQFSGLPFTSANNTSRGGGTVLWTNIPGLNDFDFISVIVAGNATNIECYQNMDSNATTGSGGFTNKAFYARFTYEAA
jgi:hypothetical protein